MTTADQPKMIRNDAGDLEIQAPASARERTPFGNFELRRSHLKTGPNPHAPNTPGAARFDAARRWPDVTADSRPADHMNPADLRSVQLTVAGYATDAADLEQLLDVLGLTPTPEEPS